ncbi:MAG: eukaryotic-like serine/threonine-protein kinase [Acidobacteriota bacterium]|jgi:DNA-binding winged helix-turn-helix (wHTH) protein/pimeloyl-ACP methyl ester carboxylesterase/class 3 adenylate cyclase|nr:eukaryotic-like serine/threonine-protein kinase [Acidobacteriota bacterium]
MSTNPGGRTYIFGPFVLDTREGMLLREGRPVQLTPKAFETLVALVERSGRCIGKEELMRRVWPDSFVEENNLSQNISQLRRALHAEGADAAQYIETVPRRGYRFNATVVVQEGTSALSENEEGKGSVVLPSGRVELFARASEVEETGEQGADEFPPELMRVPETRYALSGDVNIAYQTLGDAPLDLVFVMGWVSHLEYFWREPSVARFLRRLATFSRLILFDKRGTGLSDRVPIDQLPTLEQRMDDVRAVLEAVGSERAAIIGISEGGPLSALFAATYPERTSALVMIGTYAKRVRDEDYPWAPTWEERGEFLREMREHWGGPVGIEERAPSKADDPAFREWWAEYLRMGASPGAAVALTKMNAEIDVRHVLPTVRVPTFVIHNKGDLCLKVEEGRYVASRIPGARFVELPGSDHLPFFEGQDEVINEIEEFLTGARHVREPDRVLATLLFVNIVDRDGRVAERGEARWRDLVGRFRAHVSKELKWFRGREIDMEGAGPLATFDGPARAIRCACAVSEYAARLNIEVRAGLHTGECDLLEGGSVGGLAVEIGRAVRERAGAGEVLVSHTVKDLVAGSGITFEERGAHAFEGLPGDWRLFRVERGACGQAVARP